MTKQEFLRIEIMTKDEFLLDMLDYYTVDPEGRRCKQDYDCFYSPDTINKPTSEGCAIGRKLDKENADSIDRDFEDGVSIQELIEDEDSRIPQYMYELGYNFLNSCQSLHDKNDNWDFTNMFLSSKGQTELADMINKFDLDKSKFEKYL